MPNTASTRSINSSPPPMVRTFRPVSFALTGARRAPIHIPPSYRHYLLGGLHSVPSAHWVHIQLDPSFQVHYKLPLHPWHICNRLIVLVRHIVLPMPEHFTSIHSVPPRRPPPRSPPAEQAGPCSPQARLGFYCLLTLNCHELRLTRRRD